MRQISDHDLREVGLFQRYLMDMQDLPPRDFVTRYKEYMGLSDAEAEAYVRERTEGKEEA